MSNTENTILLIGGSDAGKTHFGGQLYGRLSARTEHYKILSSPDDISIFEEVLDKLNQGKSAGHTPVSEHRTVALEIEDKQGKKSIFSFPDYGGEQIKTIVNARRLNKIWKDQIDKSTSWMVFIRPDKLNPIEDLVNRALPATEILNKRKEKGGFHFSDSAFYVELLQMFLYAKGLGDSEGTVVPRLTIVLSCWDLLSLNEKKQLPKDILKGKLPELYSYIVSQWKPHSYSIIGLSSLSKTLSPTDSDQEFINQGPESFGYIIDQEGAEQKDLTLSISSFIE